MRIDKFLKVSRLIKRRSVANEACSASRVKINNRTAKAGTTVNVGDIITISFGNRQLTFQVNNIKESVKKEEAASMYTIIGEE